MTEIWRETMETTFDRHGVAPDSPIRVRTIQTMEYIAQRAVIRDFLPAIGINLATKAVQKPSSPSGRIGNP